MDFYLKTHTFDVCIWKANFDYHISIWLYVNVLLRKYFIFNSLKNVHDNLYSQACNLYRSSKFPAGLGHLGLPIIVLSKYRIIPNRSFTASKIVSNTHPHSVFGFSAKQSDSKERLLKLCQLELTEEYMVTPSCHFGNFWYLVYFCIFLSFTGRNTAWSISYIVCIKFCKF